jgi:hypothetical protein
LSFQNLGPLGQPLDERGPGGGGVDTEHLHALEVVEVERVALVEDGILVGDLRLELREILGGELRTTGSQPLDVRQDRVDVVEDPGGHAPHLRLERLPVGRGVETLGLLLENVLPQRV